MGNRVAIAEKVFWNCGLDVTTGGVKYRASMFIKTVLEAAFGFPNVLQIKKAALNHVDNVKSITSNVRFDFVGFTRKVESRELKHVLHSRPAWLTADNWIGDAVYAPNANHYANQRETITNADRIIHLKMSFKDLREVLFLSYEENMISEEEFILLYDKFSLKNQEFEPLVLTWELMFWSLWQQHKNVLTCTVAVMLQNYFWEASVVPKMSGA